MAGLTNLKLLTDFFNKIGQLQTKEPLMDMMGSERPNMHLG
jgi:hypothetical protein